MEYMNRKSLLYKTGVEYGDYCINHVLGCAHGCLYPCYAMMLAKRFGKVKSYEEWVRPIVVENALELLRQEIPKHRHRIKQVHFSFTTDPFMYKYPEIGSLTVQLMQTLNESGTICTALTKGCLPIELAELSSNNEVGITLISLNEDFRTVYEPFAAPYEERINSLRKLHERGVKTWASIEPYPTPNIIDQDFDTILEAISFVDKIVFGKLNYNPLVSKYTDRVNFYNELSEKVIAFCKKNNKEFYIKKGTFTNLEIAISG